MDFKDAVSAMKSGSHVHRTSQQKRELLSENYGVPIYECGTEPMRLAAAWTDDCRPVMVFQGVHSQVLFIPEPDDEASDDWEIAA